MNNLNKETILIKNIEQLKQIIKDKSYNNYELVEPIMIKGVKCSKPGPKAPDWFSSWVKNQYEKDIKHINNRLDKQEEFNEQVLNHLDNLDKRFDNLVKKNNLKE